MTLADFLLARIAEDEGVARSALAADGDTASRAPIWTSLGHGRPGVCDHGPRGSVEMQPARVLAECDAKRRIVEMCGPWVGDYDPAWRMMDGNSAGRKDALQEAVEALASVYADHPDYPA